MSKIVVDVDQTRREIRHQFALWDIDPSDFEILWEEEREGRREGGEEGW